MHQAALAAAPPPPPPESEHFNSQSPTVGRGRRRRGHGAMGVRTALDDVEPGFELEKRVQALEVSATEEETSITPPFYSEGDLMFIYEDLLAIQVKAKQPEVDLKALEQTQAAEDALTVQGAEQRLLQAYPGVPLQAVHESLQPGISQDDLQPYQSALARAEAIVTQLEEMGGLTTKGSEGQAIAGPSRMSVPISVLTMKECEALVRICTKAQDGSSALLALEIMKRSGMPIPENAVTDALEILATAGDVQATETIIKTFITTPTERQRHLHVKAHLNAAPPFTIPTSALAILHSYEEKALFAPLQTYTRCITTLYSISSVARAQAWDLFTHMRYVAHPDPDIVLYTLMIRACASPLSGSRRSEPEKALDFWTEMTVDHKIEPTVAAYNAVILACARSGERVYVNEAYRLAKEMLDTHRDARGVSAFKPNRKTFCALLEGAKRVGDLGRARWILAEMVRATGEYEAGGAGDLNRPVDVSVDEEVMFHLFHAYAVYRPPFRREATVIVHEEGRESSNETAATSSSEERTTLPSSTTSPDNPPPESNGPTAPTLDTAPSFSHIPPQSHEEVIHEAAFLFRRILNDTGVLPLPHHHQHLSPHLLDKFSQVQLTSRLINAYVHVFFRHASLDVAQKLFWKVFDQLGVQRSARVYVQALEVCAHARKGRDRDVALGFAENLWKEWCVLEENGWDGKRVSARLIERAYVAKLRLHSVNDEVDGALQLVQSFVRRYPPSSVRTPSEKPQLRSTRTSLVGARPLVRLTTTVDVPDDGVPPLLTFGDLEVLHHRLVAFEMSEEIGYIKWVAKAYEWMLRVRRDEGFRARPVKPKSELVEQ
ncbi:hypothetical protein P691DRAFT_809562 [Macrolepiota fuliginosa MF-IS2]|uniref:Pentatricopeptide repeat protein n=1 Tax=Macrolepiota fuliginosa MF-IS2 TaxID=1400762 RepID=A0A9P6C3I1_9AGAR|nr:hypothetical protein P691DRAFT_809562 [Macrolepiota fuliginosa MF-IS2]